MTWETLAPGVSIFKGDCRVAGIGAVDHVVTDPPYEDELHAAVGKINRIRTDGRRVPEDLGFDGVNADRAEFAKLFTEISQGWILVFTLAEGVRAWRDDLQACGAKWDTTLAWVKPDASPRFNGQGAARGFECICSAWNGKGYRSWNAGGKRGVYTHLVNGPAREGTHTTEKPLSLMCELIADYTQPGQTVCDPFLGSGTTALACIRLGRKFIGCEKNDTYYDLAKRRILGALDQPDFFVSVPVKAKQEKLL